MRIGIDCRLWNETGIGRYTRNLVEQLLFIDRNNEYVLFILSKDEENIKSQISNLKKKWKLEIGNWKLRPADVRWHSVEEQIKLPQILNRENLDLMHFPYFSVPIFYNRPFVITIHDLIINHFPTGKASSLPLPIYNFKRLAYNFILNIAARNAKKIITVSAATKSEIIDHLKITPDKIVVTYEGIDDKLAGNCKLKIVNCKLKNFPSKFFLYVGNAFPHKNLDRALEAFKIFDSDIKLVLVGKDDYFYNRLKNKVEEMKLSEKVIFLHDVSDEELSILYQNAKALIMPSLMEGFGLPALEAMANNCLVLASNIPALKEICGDEAIYFDPLSVNELVTKLKMLTSHTTEYEGLGEMKKKGIERAKKFSWHKMANETLKVYESSNSLRQIK